MTLSGCKAIYEIARSPLTLADLRHDHLGLNHRTRTRSSEPIRCCATGARSLQVQLICRADWGQSVRTEHHLAPPNGTRGGGSGPLASRC
jgi:hypothetical protein